MRSTVTDLSGKPCPQKPDYSGRQIQIILNGQVFQGVVKFVVEKTDGKKYNVSFDDGKRSAMVAEWQIVR